MLADRRSLSWEGCDFMIPNALNVTIGEDVEVQTAAEAPTRTFKIDFDAGRVGGFCDETEAMKQAIYKILQTERFEYLIYSWNYGIELNAVVGKSYQVFASEIKRVIREALLADSTKFTISNVKDGKLVPLYTNIKADRKLTKDDVFNYYKLSSIGKPSNQEIEIFQLFKDEPVETGTVGWVGVGNMSNNVFVPYYPILLEGMYEGYQVSTQVVTQSDKVPEGFHTWTTRNDGMYVEYPRRACL